MSDSRNTGRLPARLLGVWAHPDDECYLSAGLMARVIAAGGSVRIVCATRGEYGTSDRAEMGSPRFGRFREFELRSSLAVLGVDDVHFLGIPDGECLEVDQTEMCEVVADHIAAFDPDTVVTFGSDGITAHVDHVAVSRWATGAAPSFVDVRYAALTHAFAERHAAMHDTLGLFDDLPGRRPASIADDDVVMRVSLDHGELIRKRRALREHRSQTASLAAMVGEDTYFTWWRDECFRLPTPAESATARAIAGRDLVGAVS